MGTQAAQTARPSIEQENSGPAVLGLNAMLEVGQTLRRQRTLLRDELLRQTVKSAYLLPGLPEPVLALAEQAEAAALAGSHAVDQLGEACWDAMRLLGTKPEAARWSEAGSEWVSQCGAIASGAAAAQARWLGAASSLPGELLNNMLHRQNRGLRWRRYPVIAAEAGSTE